MYRFSRRRTGVAAALVAAGMLMAPLAQSSVAPDPGARKLQDRLLPGTMMPAPISAVPQDLQRGDRGPSVKADREPLRQARLHEAADMRTVERRVAPNVSELVRVPLTTAQPSN